MILVELWSKTCELGQIVIEGLVFRDDEFLLGVIAQSL